MTSKQLKTLINKAKYVFIFVAFLEDHVQITKVEAICLADDYSGREWEANYEIADKNLNLYIEG